MVRTYVHGGEGLRNVCAGLMLLTGDSNGDKANDSLMHVATVVGVCTVIFNMKKLVIFVHTMCLRIRVILTVNRRHFTTMLISRKGDW
jgi:hypothetical protein